MTREWIGQCKTCEVCGGRIGSVLYDANVGGLGWAVLCHSCFVGRGCKLGTGNGQKYRRVDKTEKFVKVEG